MSAKGKAIKSEVHHGNLRGNADEIGRGAVSIALDGVRLVSIDARAFNCPDASVGRFLIAQGQLIEELAAFGTGGRHA
jgi:hypothetical protein